MRYTPTCVWIVEFEQACMDREQVEGYWERQAMTMAIIDRFVVEGADQQINISDECRLRILEFEITRSAPSQIREKILGARATRFVCLRL